MNRGEITGQFLRIDKSEIGLPMRSTSMTKKEERKNVSVFDNMTKQNDKAYDDNERTFDYFDPYTTSYATDATIQPLHTRIDKHQIRSMIKPMNDSVQNISSYNSEYLNKFTLNVFYNARQTFQQSFCILPIGIMSLLAGNDLNIKKIIRQLNNSEMFYQNKVLGNNLISRTSVIQKNINVEHFGYYENNNHTIVEFPMDSQNFAIGFITDKNNNDIQLTHRIFFEYISNLGGGKLSIYRPEIKIVNKLNVNNLLKKMGYIQNNNIIYSQSLYFETCDVIHETGIADKSVDLSENFIFYIRFVPNNIILHIGYHY